MILYALGGDAKEHDVDARDNREADEQAEAKSRLNALMAEWPPRAFGVGGSKIAIRGVHTQEAFGAELHDLTEKLQRPHQTE